MNEPSYQNHAYHPTRKDGADRNLHKINYNDWLSGVRCICNNCCEKFESSRVYKARVNPQHR